MTNLQRAAQAVLDRWDSPHWEWITHGPTAVLMADLRKALAEPDAVLAEPVDQISAMDYAVAAGDAVLMNEQAALLRECRFALDCLLEKKPTLAALVCGSTTLGNLRASLYDYRPKGVFGLGQQDEPVLDCAVAIRARRKE
jgi:hypothetical protein